MDYLLLSTENIIQVTKRGKGQGGQKWQGMGYGDWSDPRDADLLGPECSAWEVSVISREDR